MKRLRLTYLYDLAGQFKVLEDLNDQHRVADRFYDLLSTQNDLRDLLYSSLLSRALRVSLEPGERLLKTLEEASGLSHDEVLGVHAWLIRQQLRDFELVFRSEMANTDAFFLTAKGAYDIFVLTEAGSFVFSGDLIQKVPEAVYDAEQAAKCLAFELCTACGFHTMRLLESVLQRYYVEISGKKLPSKRGRTLGGLIIELQKVPGAEQKLIAALTQIKDLHRNVLIHPEENLDLQEALVLLGVAQSVISIMLKKLPLATQP